MTGVGFWFYFTGKSFAGLFGFDRLQFLMVRRDLVVRLKGRKSVWECFVSRSIEFGLLNFQQSYEQTG